MAEKPEYPPAVPNPYRYPGKVIVSIPKEIKIALVDASLLNQYELWSFLTSLFFSAFIGFLVAYCHTDENFRTNLLIMGLVFLIAAVSTGAMVLLKRRKLFQNIQEVFFSVGPPVD